ncbi:PPE domain-containing protein [Allokutzneria albata]|nr:PPE domain-containing protein [Allokutzneria albata]
MAIPHLTLYNKIHEGPGPNGHLASMLYTAELMKALGETSMSLSSALTSLGAVWEGEAAERATGKISSLKSWTAAACQSTHGRGQSIADQMNAFVHARNSMPEPKDVPSLEELGKSNALRDLFQLKEDREILEGAANEAHREAARVMQAYADAVNKPVPDYDEPPRFGGGDPGGPKPGPGGIGGGGRAITRPRGGDIGAGQQISEDGGGAVVPPIPDQRGEQGLELPDGKLGEVQQASYTPPPSTLGGGGGGLGSITGPGGAAVGGGAGAAVGGLVPRAGLPVSTPSTQPLAARPVPPAVRSTGGAGGRPGFMQPALGAGQRDEDQEHERKYEITDDIVGELPMVAPPVIGE